MYIHMHTLFMVLISLQHPIISEPVQQPQALLPHQPKLGSSSESATAQQQNQTKLNFGKVSHAPSCMSYALTHMYSVMHAYTHAHVLT